MSRLIKYPCLLLLGLFSLSTFALDKPTTPSEISPAIQPQADQIKDCDNKNIVISKRGCCSWHKGVCGCANGRVVCCDGKFSPRCSC